MNRFSPVPFGIPQPISPENLFRVSKRNWLLGLITVPEGIMSFYGVPALDVEANAVLASLRLLDPAISLVKSEAPKQYKFCCGGLQIDETWEWFGAALECMPASRGLSLWSFCEFFDKHEELWSDPELLELLELIRDSSSERVFNQVCEIYAFPKFCLR